jgi:hypothetical protein
MMVKKRNLLALLLLLSVGIIACDDDETYPLTPEISFKSLEKFVNVSQSDSLVLTFSFTDGDGDIGSPESDPARRDVFVRLFERKNGVFEEAILAAPLEYRIPYLTPRGNNKSLKGDVKINIDYNILQPNDTIFYKIFIKDRADRKSNEITTGTIITRVQ